MKMDNKYLIECLVLIKDIARILDLDYDNSLRDFFSQSKKMLKEKTISLSLEDRLKFENYITSINVERLGRKITTFLFFNEHNVENRTTDLPIVPDNLPDKTLKDLSDNFLLRFFFRILDTISFFQHPIHKNLYILKYNKSIWTIGFNELSVLCRGKVIDIKTNKIVSYTYDKFFNIDENIDNSKEIIKEKLKESDYTLLLDKKDGSTLTITPTENYGTIITTGGSFDNSQVLKAEKMLKEQYTFLRDNLKDFYGKSLIFEIIYPANKVVIDYGTIEQLVLLGVRDLNTYSLSTYEELQEISSKYEIPLTEKYDFISLDELLEYVKEAKNVNREGYVLRIDKNKKSFLCKIKFEEYFLKHKMMLNNINIYSLYELILNNTLDDYLPSLTEENREKVLYFVDKISNIKQMIDNKIIETIEEVQKEIIYTPKEIETIKKDKNHPQYKEIIDLIKKINSLKKGWIGTCVRQYFLSGKSIEELLVIELYTFKQIMKAENINLFSE